MNAQSPASELFLRGAERYLDALAAIAAFRGEVQDMCKKVYEHHRTELAAQMGLDAVDCAPYDDDDPGARSAYVGVSRTAQQSCFFYVYLSWSEDERVDDMIAVAVSLDLYYTRLRNEVFEAFRQKKPGCRVEKFEGYSLVLSQSLKDLSSTRDALDALVLEWLDYCKAIGGLKLNERKTV